MCLQADAEKRELPPVEGSFFLQSDFMFFSAKLFLKRFLGGIQRRIPDSCMMPERGGSAGAKSPQPAQSSPLRQATA